VIRRILSFGGGVQTTALAILICQGKVKADMAIFADTGCERPETYWYMDTYMKPMFSDAGIPLQIVRSEVLSEQQGLYECYWNNKTIVGVNNRRCTDHFKLRPIRKATGKEVHFLIGFSADEVNRTKRKRTLWAEESYPLVDLGLTGSDCQRLISSEGMTVPLKSSCYICPFQPPFEWHWLKNNHPDLFQKALDLEARWHERKPQFRNTFGMYRGLPLRHIAEGKQYSMGLTLEKSCWSGHCGH